MTQSPSAAPPWWLSLTELPRSLFDLGMLAASAPALMAARRGDGHAVLVLPGFVANDLATAPLRQFLTSHGYAAHGWELGANLGPRAVGRGAERLLARLDAIHAQTGRSVSLVGWSLGGAMARMIAYQRPQQVRQLITLGAPLLDDPRTSSAWRSYQMVSGERFDSAAMREHIAQANLPMPVPATALYSRVDGVVGWESCLEPDAPRSENIEVGGSHCGLPVNPQALWAIADRLAQVEGEWAAFKRPIGWINPSAVG